MYGYVRIVRQYLNNSINIVSRIRKYHKTTE